MKFLKFLPTTVVKMIVQDGLSLLEERREISFHLIGSGDKYPFEYGIQGYKIRSMLLPCGQYEWTVYHHDRQVQSGIVVDREDGFQIAASLVLKLQGE